MSAGCHTSDFGSIGVMWKTVSEDCNLACDYCYYSTCGGKPGPRINRIDSKLLDKFINEYMAMCKGSASFAWQGGEPLLAGLEFFEEVVSLQARHAKPNTVISNALQTNGTLITEKWARFFQTYRFLIGVSLDGPRDIHDARRVDSAGKGSFDRVMQGIGQLRMHGVDFNILTVIHKGNVDNAKNLLAFYRKEGFGYIQFIPCMDFRSQQVNRPGVYDITPEEYGEFLCQVFDVWYNEGNPELSIRFFDNALSVYVNREAELCVHRAECPQTLILEQNGDAYPCDFYIHDSWRLGNVGENRIEELLSHPRYEDFKAIKPNLPEKCHSCNWKSLCHGGCPRNRTWTEDKRNLDSDYFCSSYKRVYAYAHKRMEALGESLRKTWYDRNIQVHLKGKPPGRNELCACGSSKKHKHCCGNRRPGAGLE